MEFTRKDICEKTMLDPRTVLHYSERGVILPQIEETGGAGRYRRYSLWNLFEFFILKELIGYGMHISNMRGVMSNLSSHFFPDGIQTSSFNPKAINPNTYLISTTSDGRYMYAAVCENVDLTNFKADSFFVVDLHRIGQKL